jgi:hypothetical protein
MLELEAVAVAEPVDIMLDIVAEAGSVMLVSYIAHEAFIARGQVDASVQTDWS